MAKRGTRGKGRKVAKRQTIAEFRAWLEGVEELQNEEWFPDVNQWILIREKIDKIIDPIAEQPVMGPGAMRNFNQGPGILAPGIPAPPPVPGGVPSGGVIQPSLDPGVSAPAGPIPSEQAAGLFQQGTPNAPKKTPEVGSGGPFNSPFE